MLSLSCFNYWLNHQLRAHLTRAKSWYLLGEQEEFSPQVLAGIWQELEAMDQQTRVIQEPMLHTYQITHMNLLYANLALPRYGQPFIEKVILISGELGIRPEWLMCVMKNESSINHAAVNATSGATGLIQFMPATAKGLGTTTQELKAMDALAQLDYVKKYFWPYRNKIKTATDLYIITFYPYALTQPDSYVIGSQKGAAYVRLVALQNKGFDLNKDQQVTLGEFRQSVRQKTFKDLSDAQMFK